MEIDDMTAKLNAAYLAGFMASCEGYNGEYPFDFSEKEIMSDEKWVRVRDDDLRAMISEK